MKKSLSLLLLLAAALLTVAQEPLLTPQQMPNPIRFLPPPPDTASAAFAYDQAQYRWGLQQRQDTLRAAIAAADANWRIEYICQIFSEPFGLELSASNTPAIYRLLYIALITNNGVGQLPKQHYQRTRPYVYFSQPSLVPGDEDELRHNGSYPSGHTIEGWSAALLLTELNPDSADAILARGFLYGQSRVIAGYHWQSDVDAGMLAASAGIARLHADRRFQRLMDKARREFRKKRPTP